MSTNDQFVHLTNKKLLGITSFKTYFLDYLRDSFHELFAAVYNKDGTYGLTALEITEASLLLSIDTGTGTDGAGHLLSVGDTEQDVPWPRASGTTYHVGLHYTERPVGIQINPRTGLPEYQNWKEVIGETATPDSVSVLSGPPRLELIVNSLGASGVTLAGRRCLVWLITPAAGTTTEAIAIEECEIQFDGDNFIETTGLLGSALGESTASLYQVLLLGPTIRSDIDLEVTAGYWFIGDILWNGTAFSFDDADQRLITKSLSDLLDHLVYDNVQNTFTRGQTIYTTTGDEIGLVATGSGTGSGGYFTGGTSGGTGLIVRGGSGISSGPGADIDAVGGNNYGLKASGRGNEAGVKGYGGLTGGIGGEFYGGGGSASGLGVRGVGGVPDGWGGKFEGTGTGAGSWSVGGSGGGTGVIGDGGTAGGPGGHFQAMADNAPGTVTIGNGTGAGLDAEGGATGPGIFTKGGGTGGYGIEAEGTGTLGSGIKATGYGAGYGGEFYGHASGSGGGLKAYGAPGGVGGEFHAGSGNCNGVWALGTGTYPGVFAEGGLDGPGGKFQGGTNGANLNLPPRSGVPSTIANGDIWVTNTQLCCRIGGVNYSVNLTAL